MLAKRVRLLSRAVGLEVKELLQLSTSSHGNRKRDTSKKGETRPRVGEKQMARAHARLWIYLDRVLNRVLWSLGLYGMRLRYI